jgi:hypothetical protein
MYLADFAAAEQEAEDDTLDQIRQDVEEDRAFDERELDDMLEADSVQDGIDQEREDFESQPDDRSNG